MQTVSSPVSATGSQGHHAPARTLARACVADTSHLARIPALEDFPPNSVDSIMRQLRRVDLPIVNYIYKGFYMMPRVPDEEWLTAAVAHDFPDSPGVVLHHTLTTEPARVARGHVTIACEFTRFSADEYTITQLSVIHTYLCAHHLLLDAIADAHSESPLGVLDLSPLLAAVARRVTELAAEKGSLRLCNAALSALEQCTLSCRRALREESRFRDDAGGMHHAQDRQHIVDRSSCATFLLDLISLLSGTRVPDILRNAVSDYLYWCQVLDDLGDWREDFARKNMTPFLCKCLTHCGGASDLATLESAIYFEGLYEQELVTALQGLRTDLSAAARLTKHACMTRKVLTREYSALFQRLTDFIQIKLTAQSMSDLHGD